MLWFTSQICVADNIIAVEYFFENAGSILAQAIVSILARMGMLSLFYLAEEQRNASRKISLKPKYFGKNISNESDRSAKMVLTRDSFESEPLFSLKLNSTELPIKLNRNAYPLYHYFKRLRSINPI